MRYLIALLILWPSIAFADTLVLIPKVPDKPIFSLQVVDKITKKTTERKMTDKELLKQATYDARKANYIKSKGELGRPLTGNYKQLISSKGPVWSKDEIDYTISCFSDSKRIKGKIAVKNAEAIVVDTGKLGGAEWLLKNGYEPNATGIK